jgi:hypothetical protein
MMARVFDRTPMREPGGGKENLGSGQVNVRCFVVNHAGYSLDGGSSQCVVRFGLRDLLHELGEIARVVDKLLLLVMDLQTARDVRSWALC